MTTQKSNEWKGLLFAILAVILAAGAVQGLAVLLRTQIPPEAGEKHPPLPKLVFKTSPELVGHGQKLYSQFCSHCHGDDAKGGKRGAPSLVKLDITDQQIEYIVLSGIKNKMPGFRKKLQDQDVVDIVAYLDSLK